MSRTMWILAAVLGVGGVLAWSVSQPGKPTMPAEATTAPVVAAPATTAAAAPVAVPAARASAEQVARWVEEANGADASKRAAAISALASAPRAQALPVLRHVLINGEPGVDRPLALKSLRELALAQGDADGEIRAAFREVIYHGDDESLAAASQDALGVVE